MSKPIVSFDIRAVEDRDKSISSGRYSTRDAEFVILRQPGDNRTTVEKEITRDVMDEWKTQEHKLHIPALYDAWKAGLEAPVDGKPLKEWTIISPAQLHQAMSIGLRSVEDLAGMSDEACRNFGIGAQLLKQKARNWLESVTNGGAVAEKLTALEVRDKERDELLKKQQEELEAMKKAMDDLNKPAAAPKSSKPKAETPATVEAA